MRDFKELFKEYQFKFSDAEVSEKVKFLIDKNYENNDTKATLQEVFSFLDITSLSIYDNEKTITELVERVNAFDETAPEMPTPAGICVYPTWVETVKNTLTEDINIVTVIGFPHAQNEIEIKTTETALAVMAGATEIDMVLPVGKFLLSNYDEVYEEISEIKAACHTTTLKVILETSALKTAQNIYNASIIAMQAGANFIKTSTGKEGAATLSAAYVMCTAIYDYYTKTGIKIGFKAAGGIKTKQEAIMYYSVIKSILGQEWLSPELFRIGTSSLVDELIK